MDLLELIFEILGDACGEAILYFIGRVTVCVGTLGRVKCQSLTGTPPLGSSGGNYWIFRCRNRWWLSVEATQLVGLLVCAGFGLAAMLIYLF